MTQALLHLRGVRKSFGARVLLDGIDLTLEEGAAAVLTGANGSGKTTLLRIIAGLEPATIAAASFAGQSLQLTPYPRALRAAIGYVHQQPLLFSSSVTANIAYGLHGRGLTTPEVRARVDAAMAWAGVAHLRGLPTASLSGGEKQRVALARAEVLAPRLLLLDEPTANLDGPAREQVLALIRNLAVTGRTVLVVGHDRDVIHLPGVRRLKLRDGRLEQR